MRKRLVDNGDRERFSIGKEIARFSSVNYAIWMTWSGLVIKGPNRLLQEVIHACYHLTKTEHEKVTTDPIVDTTYYQRR